MAAGAGIIRALTGSRSRRRFSATYTSLVYLTPILGGIIADKLTGPAQSR